MLGRLGGGVVLTAAAAGWLWLWCGAQAAAHAGGQAPLAGMPAAPASGLGMAGWSLDPPVIVGLAAAALAYARIRRRFGGAPAGGLLFGGGLVTLFLAWQSPLDRGGEAYLFTLHVLQHMLTGIGAPVLLVLGLPPGFTAAARRWPVLGAAVRGLWRPLPAFGLYVANLLVWHLPVLWELALGNRLVHDLQHILYLGTGLLFWGVILSPHPKLVGASDGSRFAMLVGANLANWLASLPIALTSQVLYPTYARAPRLWGLSAESDQALGAGVMWMMGHLVYGIPLVLLIARFLRREEREADRAALKS